jgi:hypothetical protein
MPPTHASTRSSANLMPAVVMNKVWQLHRPGSITLAQWAALATAAGVVLLCLLFHDPIFRETTPISSQGLVLMLLFHCADAFSDNQLFRQFNSPWAIILHLYEETGAARGGDGYRSTQRGTVRKLQHAAVCQLNEGD